MNVEAHVFVSMTQTLVSELRRITEDESGIWNNPNSLKWSQRDCAIPFMELKTEVWVASCWRHKSR